MARKRSQPATTEEIHEILAQFVSQGQHPPFEYHALETIGLLLEEPLKQAASGGLLSWSAPRFTTSDLEVVFGLDAERHLFEDKALSWLRPTEPQVTRGLAHFLRADGNLRVSARRFTAFLRGLGIPSNSPSDISVQSEAAAGDKLRIDLLFEWQDGGSRSLLVEAKFEHAVSKEQMHAYLKHAESALRGSDRSSILLVPGTRAAAVREEVGRWGVAKNRDIRVAAWEDVLLAMNRTLTSEDDTDEFRTFRRTVWNRATRA